MHLPPQRKVLQLALQRYLGSFGANVHYDLVLDMTAKAGECGLSRFVSRACAAVAAYCRLVQERGRVRKQRGIKQLCSLLFRGASHHRVGVDLSTAVNTRTTCQRTPNTPKKRPSRCSCSPSTSTCSSRATPPRTPSSSHGAFTAPWT